MKHIVKTLLLTLIVSVAFAQEKTVRRTFKNVNKIIMTTASSDVVISKGNDKTVQFDLTHYYNEDEYSPVFEQDGTMLTTKEEFKRNSVSGKSGKWVLAILDDIDIQFWLR